MPEELSGATIWQTLITPRRPALQELGAYLQTPGKVNRASWPGLELERIINDSDSILRARWTRTLEETQEQKLRQASLPNAGIGWKSDSGFPATTTRLSWTHHTAVTIAPLLDALPKANPSPRPGWPCRFQNLSQTFAVENAPLQRDMLAFISSWLGANQDIRRAVEADIEAHGLQLAKNLRKVQPAFGKFWPDFRP